MKIRLWLVLFFITLSNNALAWSVNAFKQGSAIIALGTNTSDQLVRCNYDVKVSYEQFGTPGTHRNQGTFDIAPKADSQRVFYWPTSWSASTLNLDFFNYNCS
ncbi:hypothetical protein ACCY16_14580 [Candidatus Pantoea formicae]|uniref:hypothetical protein n=1 Tax=Candidatus Pantoea formicae TaxID=2608355 RepID=UPI003EDB5F58